MSDTPRPQLRDAFRLLLAAVRDRMGGTSGGGGVTSGVKTYLAAAAMAGFGAFLIWRGNPSGGVQAILTALGIAGLRVAIPTPTPGPSPAPTPLPPGPDTPPAPTPRQRPILKAILAALVGGGSFLGARQWMPPDQVAPPAPIPPQPGPPAPLPPAPTPPAPRPSDDLGGSLWDAYQADGGPTAVNAGAKDQLRAVYTQAAKLARSKDVTTGETLASKVRDAAKTLLGDHYLNALPKVRAAINTTVSDHLEPGALTDASREHAATLFESIAKALGSF